MKKICFYDAKPYDKLYFDNANQKYKFQIDYIESKLNRNSARLAHGYDAVCAFVNDDIGAETIDVLCEQGISTLVLRCAGYNNVDLEHAKGKLRIFRVPEYSPYAVAEHTMALLLTLCRKTHRAFIRTRDYNFSLNGLTGFDLHGKTAGVIGTGRIGRAFADICRGFGMRILAYDPYPIADANMEYVDIDTLCRESDVISLHCPLTRDTYHIINKTSLGKMKRGVYILNTSRGALIDSKALLDAIRKRKIGGAGLDVYEEETEVFYEDFSNEIIDDDILVRLLAMPNVLITSHQGYLTNEALLNIAHTTLENLNCAFRNKKSDNEIMFTEKS